MYNTYILCTYNAHTTRHSVNPIGLHNARSLMNLSTKYLLNPPLRGEHRGKFREEYKRG